MIIPVPQGDAAFQVSLHGTLLSFITREARTNVRAFCFSAVASAWPVELPQGEIKIGNEFVLIHVGYEIEVMEKERKVA